MSGVRLSVCGGQLDYPAPKIIVRGGLSLSAVSAFLSYLSYGRVPVQSGQLNPILIVRSCDKVCVPVRVMYPVQCPCPGAV
jgi:hypothetical protein